MHHHLTWWLAPPFKPDGLFVTACARTGSATAFALTVLMIGVFATNWSCRTTGFLTATSLVLMPRLFGHAHLASLETITNLTCAAAVLSVANWWHGPKPPTRKVAMLTGVVMGLALLTKIQAVLIPIPVICWALWRWRMKAIVPLICWGLAALVVFFVGWPYLWFDIAKHVLRGVLAAPQTERLSTSGILARNIPTNVYALALSVRDVRINRSGGPPLFWFARTPSVLDWLVRVESISRRDQPIRNRRPLPVPLSASATASQPTDRDGKPSGTR